MTASTPNPADSGAAASRDAARTARRLTDGTLPRTSPPDPGCPPATPEPPGEGTPAGGPEAGASTPIAQAPEPVPESAPVPAPAPAPAPAPVPEPEPGEAVGSASGPEAVAPGDDHPAERAAAEKAAEENAPAPAPAPTPAPADALDFGRIRAAGVGAVAVPVAAVVRVARRKNVIGTETTGSIPVHLLFRDGPEPVVPVAADDDGGPDTIAMAAPTPPAVGRRPAIPAPSKVQAPTRPDPEPRIEPRTEQQSTRQSRPQPAAKPKPQPKAQPGLQPRFPPKPQPQSRPQPKAQSRPQHPVSRPAPTADPALVERPGPVLPGWVGVVAGALAVAGCAAVVWWAGAVPAEAARMLRLPARPYHGIHLGQWALLALGVVLALFALGGLGRGRVGYAWVLTLFGDYRGTVRRTGLVWVSPLLLRRRVDVRLRHWRSEPLSAVDAKGTALDVTVLVVWRVRDTVRAALGVDGHEEYLREQVEAAMARVLSQLPADAFHEDAPTLRDAEAVGEALTRMLSAECAPVGVDVFSAQPTRIEYAPEVAAAMRRRRIAAIDAKHRDSVLTSVVDAVDDVVHRLTSRGLVELDDYERKALVKDLTVAFYTGRTGPVEGA
ncbi:SPFH domain-containing protein [Streptomyces sp. NPDC004284]|uniref:SPFH domain-containing protein n=1 Tax=Streptomyces sp. NPDC004284 TaxID=3364695 RepID=UPI00367B4112